MADVDASSVISKQFQCIFRQPCEEYNELVARCQRNLQQCGSCVLESFIDENVLQQMCDEVSDLPSYHRLGVVRAYGYSAPADRNLPPSHPLQRKFAQDVRAVAADQIPRSALIQLVYRDQRIIRFLSDVLGMKQLYLFSDEFQHLNIMYMDNGGSRAWHYDGSDFVVTLLLQQGSEGGEFEFAPFVRGPRLREGIEDMTSYEENFSQVERVFNGTYPTQKTRVSAGTLCLFNGLRSMHRVRTVYGPQRRIIAVLSYDTDPQFGSWKERNVRLYGPRVAEIYEERERRARTNSS